MRVVAAGNMVLCIELYSVYIRIIICGWMEESNMLDSSPRRRRK